MTRRDADRAAAEVVAGLEVVRWSVVDHEGVKVSDERLLRVVSDVLERFEPTDPPPPPPPPPERG